MDSLPKPSNQESSQVGEHEEQVSDGVSVTVVRDVGIIIVLTLVGSFLVGVAGTYLIRNGLVRGLALGLSILLFMTIGFTISGCFARRNRWRHLVFVAIGVWLASLMEIFIHNRSIGDLVVTGLIVVGTMGIGGALSYAFKRGNSGPSP